jgi:hypothetical protein
MSTRMTIPKEVRGYNVDYFHNIILYTLGIDARAFLRIAFGIQDPR